MVVALDGRGKQIGSRELAWGIYAAAGILGLPALTGTAIGLPGYWLWMGVAFVMFYPGMQTNSPWLENEIWITYVPAWTLIFINLLEEKLVD